MIIPILIILFVISFIWAIISLRSEIRKPKEIHHVKEEFKREKILYKA